jgi:hypothetical protein
VAAVPIASQTRIKKNQLIKVNKSKAIPATVRGDP